MNSVAAKKNTTSIFGMSLGMLALCVSVLYFWAGPIAPPQPIENVVAEKVVALRSAVTAKLRGEEPASKTSTRSWDADRILVLSTIVGGLLAIILGCIAFVRREDNRVCGSAVALGASAIAFQFLAVALVAIVIAILVYAVLGDLGVG